MQRLIFQRTSHLRRYQCASTARKTARHDTFVSHQRLLDPLFQRLSAARPAWRRALAAPFTDDTPLTVPRATCYFLHSIWSGLSSALPTARSGLAFALHGLLCLRLSPLFLIKTKASLADSGPVSEAKRVLVLNQASWRNVSGFSPISHYRRSTSKNHRVDSRLESLSYMRLRRRISPPLVKRQMESMYGSQADATRHCHFDSRASYLRS